MHKKYTYYVKYIYESYSEDLMKTGNKKLSFVLSLLTQLAKNGKFICKIISAVYIN